MRGLFHRRFVVGFAVVWIVAVTAAAASGLTLAATGRASVFSGDSEEEVLARYSRLNEVYDILTEDYYEDVDPDALVQGAIDGMMGALGDPYTFYYTPEEMQAENETMAGAFVGVGIMLSLQEDGRLEITEVYTDSPAERAGVLIGDHLLQVDEELLSGGDTAMLNRAAELIRGEEGTGVILIVERGGETLEIPAVRGMVETSYAQYQVLDGGIGYIRIARFFGNASAKLQEAIAAFRDAGVTGMVVDLRDNPGGQLDNVVDCLDQVMPKGLLVYLEDRAGAREEYYSDGDYWDIPMAILVNAGSASASEVFTGAVKDGGRGVVIGETTYGKGIVQTVVTFGSDGAGLQYTSEVYFTPGGTCIHGVGITPDIQLLDDPDTETDEALERAIGELTK